MYVLINIMKAYFYALLAISASNLLTCIVVGIWSHRRLQYENMVWVRHQMGDSATVSDTEREDMRGEITLASDLSDTLPSNTTSFASDQTTTLIAHVMTNTSFFTATVEPLESPDTNVTIFVITPTYSRLTQKVDLTSLCQTLMHVPTLVWIVIEDSPKKTPMVTSLLARCNVTSVHMNVESPDNLAIEQRYLGLKWVKDTCKPPSCKGVVYFGDDDNKYDLRLFEEIRQTQQVAVMNVAFAGGLYVEGPSCKEGKAVKWRTGWGADRVFTLDMAGFAVNAQVFTKYPDVWVGKRGRRRKVKIGYMETTFLEKIGATKESVECRSNPEEVLVWHIRTEKRMNLSSTTSDSLFEV